MYGVIHEILKKFVIAKVGKAEWAKFLEAHKLLEKDFQYDEIYNDDATMRLISLTAGFMDMQPSTLTEKLGKFYLDYHLNSDSAGIIKGLGDNFVTFVNNLNDMHFLMRAKYENLIAPTFRCNVVGDGMVSVNYYSMRKGLFGLAEGLLRAICQTIFELDVIVTVDDRPKTGLGQFKEHIVYSISTLSDDPKAKQLLVGPEPAEGHETDLQLLTDEEWCAALPFHVFFNSDMIVLQMGHSIRKLCNVKPDDKVKVTDIFELKEPPVTFAFKNVLKYLNSPFLLAAVPLVDRKEKEKKTAPKVVLAGRMITDPGDCDVVFVGCPHGLQLEDLFDGRLHVSDLPRSDCSQAVLSENHHIAEEEELRMKIEETEEEIALNEKRLQMKHSNITTDCYQMLPPSVKATIQQGKTVAARNYNLTTALMLDIPTFGDILPKVSPSVSVKVLNDTYCRLDSMVEKFEVFKVRATGEHYLVVGGVPDVTEDHAVRICALSLEMMQTVKLVPQPQSNTPVRIRIGIYSGQVITSLLGEEVPKYCVFGPAIDMAELLMTHGVPGRIHIGQATAILLEEHDFRLCDRGDMLIGENVIETYLLFGYKDHEFEDLKCTKSTRLIRSQLAPGCCPTY